MIKCKFTMKVGNLSWFSSSHCSCFNIHRLSQRRLNIIDLLNTNGYFKREFDDKTKCQSKLSNQWEQLYFHWLPCFDDKSNLKLSREAIWQLPDDLYNTKFISQDRKFGFTMNFSHIWIGYAKSGLIVFWKRPYCPNMTKKVRF